MSLFAGTQPGDGLINRPIEDALVENFSDRAEDLGVKELLPDADIIGAD